MNVNAKPSKGAVSPAESNDINRKVYESPKVYRFYESRALAPSEIACLLKYQPHFVGRDVLDIGVGAGRTAYYLAPLAKRYEAIDYSEVMVNYMKRTMPHLSVRRMDFRDLQAFEKCSIDFIFASNNVIDALPHDGRLQALSESFRVLRPNGILAVSSHNIHYKNAFSKPAINWSRNPARLLLNCEEYILCWWNYVRVAPLRQTAADHAILNDPGHYYSTLHYYASKSTVESQLQNAGLQLLEVFDSKGASLNGAANDTENPSLLYVATRPPGK